MTPKRCELSQRVFTNALPVATVVSGPYHRQGASELYMHDHSRSQLTLEC
jgi:hypothetical protein